MANFMNKMKPAPMKKPAKPAGMKPAKATVKEISAEDVSHETEEVIEETSVDTEATVSHETEENFKISEEETTPICDPEETTKEAGPVEESQIEEVKEVEEVKPKKKTSRKKSKKETKVQESAAKVALLSIDEAEEALADEIVPIPEYWEKEKDEINGMISKIVITEELNPTSLKQLVAKMSETYTIIQNRLQEAKTNYENLKDMIDAIKSLNAIGSSSDERKYNSIKAATQYKKNEDDEKAIDLLAYLRFNRQRYEYYTSALKTIDTNRQLLITFSAAFKLELGQAF